mgnify:CR=1 FL=1
MAPLSQVPEQDQLPNIIDNAIEDVNNILQFDRLVITVDAEEMTRQEKIDEIKQFLGNKKCRVEIRIVIQFFCFEAWALGNQKIIKRNPSSTKLRKYRNFYDVRLKDPELLPEKKDEELTRSQFAEKYLRIALNDRFRNLTYRKNDPKALLHEKYFNELVKRLTTTSHIMSFEDFLSAFKN